VGKKSALGDKAPSLVQGASTLLSFDQVPFLQPEKNMSSRPDWLAQASLFEELVCHDTSTQAEGNEEDELED